MYTLHHIPDWASLIIRLALADAAVPVTLQPIDYEAGALDSPAYRALNPLGLVPVLETPDGPVFETGAILLWLADRHPGLAPPPRDPARAAFLSWFIFTANTLHPTLMTMVYPERLGGEGGRAAIQAQATANFRTQIGHLDRVAATGPAWLNPATPSALVPYLAVLMRWAAILPATPVLPATAPHLHRVLAAYEARPHVAAIAAEEGLGPLPFSAPQP